MGEMERIILLFLKRGGNKQSELKNKNKEMTTPRLCILKISLHDSRQSSNKAVLWIVIKCDEILHLEWKEMICKIEVSLRQKGPNAIVIKSN